MPITLDKPYLGLRIAASSNVPVFAPREGFCDGIVLDTPYVGLRAASLDGEPVFVVGDQKLNADGTAILDKPYIGLRASQVDGTLVYLVDGKDECEPCAVLAGERATPYPTTLYVEDVLFMSATFPGVTYPFPIVETSAGSRVWTGTDPTGDNGFPVTFTMDCEGNIPGTLRFRAVGFFTNLLDAVGRTPSSFDPFNCRFYQTTIGGITWDVVE